MWTLIWASVIFPVAIQERFVGTRSSSLKKQVAFTSCFTHSSFFTCRRKVGSSTCQIAAAVLDTELEETNIWTSHLRNILISLKRLHIFPNSKVDSKKKKKKSPKHSNYLMRWCYRIFPQSLSYSSLSFSTALPKTELQKYQAIIKTLTSSSGCNMFIVIFPNSSVHL